MDGFWRQYELAATQLPSMPWLSPSNFTACSREPEITLLVSSSLFIRAQQDPPPHSPCLSIPRWIKGRLPHPINPNIVHFHAKRLKRAGLDISTSLQIMMPTLSPGLALWMDRRPHFLTVALANVASSKLAADSARVVLSYPLSCPRVVECVVHVRASTVYAQAIHIAEV
ncbi:hypothetical protein J6590_010028 [Homalodisca vitripennis]|nr:hypothetical protein J6590_010028 [Homalodisca vitripennis]